MKIPGQEIPLADFKQQPLPSPKIFFKKKNSFFGKASCTLDDPNSYN